MIDQTQQGISKLDELKSEFMELDIRDRLDTLLEFSEALPELPDRYCARREAGENRVHECQTPVFLWTEVVDGRVAMFADAPRDSPTVRGFVSLLIAGFSGATVGEVLAVKTTLIADLGLTEALGMVRMRGLHAILHRTRCEVQRAAAQGGS